MTQVFADGEQLGAEGGSPDRQSVGWLRPMIRPRRSEDEDASPALTAGKGVRPVTCVGCSQPTLPRATDDAPLCARCSDLLADSVQRFALAGRWLRRRSAGN